MAFFILKFMIFLRIIMIYIKSTILLNFIFKSFFLNIYHFQTNNYIIKKINLNNLLKK